MRSLERHRDVGAYALGVLDEAAAFGFEDYLTECASCAAHVTDFRPAARQLMLYRRATPGSVHPFAVPGPRLLERLLDEVNGKHDSGRRRWLHAVAACVVFALGGPTVAVVAGRRSASSAAMTMSATDPDTGIWAQVTTQDREWGSQVDVRFKDRSGPHPCQLVAVGKDGSEQTVTSWMLPADDGETTVLQGGTAMQPKEIDRFDVRTRDGQHLVTFKAR